RLMAVGSSKALPPGTRLRAGARVVVACSIAIFCSALAVGRGAALDAHGDFLLPAPSVSLSTGLPWHGRLLRAVRLNMGPSLRPVTEYTRSGNFYGTSELVTLLERSAQVVATRWPGSQLSVGELSGPRGGKISGHRSHQNGRDVDVAFFMQDGEGRAT